MQLLLTTVLLCAAARAAGGACQRGLGCFPDGPPWSSPERPVPPPRTREEVDTYFTLYTRSTRYAGRNLTAWPAAAALGDPDYRANRSTMFLVPGLSRSWNVTWLHRLKNNVLDRGDYNVILTHWGGDRSSNYSYYQAVSDTRVVGAELARLGRALVEQHHVSPGSFHVVGHSLGAQIAGYMGQNITGLGRITGLDATQVGFVGYPRAVRLDSRDAQLVEDIHTALQPPIVGLADSRNLPIGHVDVYVNGGNVQPGCNKLNKSLDSVADYALLSPADVANMSGCSHLRSVDLYLEATSGSGCVFWARRWLASPVAAAAQRGAPCGPDTCRPIGLQQRAGEAPGVFDLETTAAPPYCIPTAEGVKGGG
ncbi:inactive pancreatic lipase-related protein 1-like [Bacillus rossius redtenbacheri]|uniref:inactive pancreatic lipase-related protein 1-like n=1 Tax=Bacillus rossius redtenbacheri TaxID=93214 RepID=UPI002FDF03ED